MNINLHDITGQESGVILVDTGAGRQNVVANWGDRDGLPYFMPYYAATSDPFPFLFMDVADIHVDRSSTRAACATRSPTTASTTGIRWATIWTRTSPATCIR